MSMRECDVAGLDRGVLDLCARTDGMGSSTLAAPS
jgi:hypothetical protein